VHWLFGWDSQDFKLFSGQQFNLRELHDENLLWTSTCSKLFECLALKDKKFDCSHTINLWLMSYRWSLFDTKRDKISIGLTFR